MKRMLLVFVFALALCCVGIAHAQSFIVTADKWCYPVTPFRLSETGPDMHCPVIPHHTMLSIFRNPPCFLCFSALYSQSHDD